MGRVGGPLRAARLAAALVVFAALVCVTAAYVVPLPERLRVPGSPVVTWADGSTAHVALAPDDRWRVAVSGDDVDPRYVDALVAYEDARFWLHPGVDPLAVLRAAWENGRSGRVVSGASTLTMQVVRVLEPRPRTLRSKAVEALRAMQLELRLSKREVLAAYLTFAPFGRNVEGVEAAAWSYFGHSAQHLSAAEIATLLAVPQRPNSRFPSADHALALRGARDEVAAWLEARGELPSDGEGGVGDGLAAVRAAPVPARLRPFPRQIPHAVAWLGAAVSPGATVITTLDAGTQATVERLVDAARDPLARRGIDQVAVVVVDHQAAEVRALVGGFDFWDASPGAQIPAFGVPRSPGSALKPWIYALALERGEVLPEQLVLDVPVRYGGYAPQNYERTYDGLVPIEEALHRSLNVPFVRLLDTVGVERLLGSLTTLGVTGLDESPGYYGLSAAVGGIELAPVDLAAVFCALATGGQAQRPIVLADAARPPPLRVVSPGTAWLTRRALAYRDRPDFPSRRALSGLPAGIAWKTGTSFGHRDAWAAGWDARHTVVVWLGNLDQRPSVHLVGADAAGPLLFDVLEALAGAEAPGDPPPPADLGWVEVCAYSGHPPGPACPVRRPVRGVVEHVPTAVCPYHVAVDVDDATGLALAPGCRDDRPHHTEVMVRWPARARRYLAGRHRALPEAPSLFPGCSPPPAERPIVVSPIAGQVSLLLPGVDPSEQEIPLIADAPADAVLSWFVDGVFLGTAGPDERLWWEPSVGEHRVAVQDQLGRTARVEFAVRVRR